MNYITFKKMFDYVDRIEKARSHKYIDRRPKKTGKGWYYIYAETFKKPFRALLEIFDIKKERIDKDYEEDNIQKDFGVDKNLYASHVLEFFLNREKWHNIFSKKENRQKYTQAVKQSDVEKKAKEKKEKSTEKKKTTTETTKTQKLNRSLMFRIWQRNTPEAEKLLEENKERFVLNKITGVDKLTEEDFTSPKRSVLLAPMANNFYEQTGVEKKEILIKQNIFEKNKNHHPEIKTVEENRKIIENALYGNNIAMLCKPNEKPNYWTVVKADDYYYLAVIDTDPSKEYHEVVGWRRISDKGFENMKKQVEKEGGQFLIMGGNAVDHSADLSDVQSNHNENISESNSDVNGEHGNKEAMKGNQNAKKFLNDIVDDYNRIFEEHGKTVKYRDLSKEELLALIRGETYTYFKNKAVSDDELMEKVKNSTKSYESQDKEDILFERFNIKTDKQKIENWKRIKSELDNIEDMSDIKDIQKLENILGDIKTEISNSLGAFDSIEILHQEEELDENIFGKRGKFYAIRSNPNIEKLLDETLSEELKSKVKNIFEKLDGKRCFRFSDSPIYYWDSVLEDVEAKTEICKKELNRLDKNISRDSSTIQELKQKLEATPSRFTGKIADIQRDIKSEEKNLAQEVEERKSIAVALDRMEQDKASVTDVNSEHGNKTAMLGNQNAFKGHLANKETVKFVNTVKGELYEEWNTDVNKFAVYYNRETGKETGIAMTKDIADIIDSHNEPSVLDWQDNIAEDIHAKYPKIDKQYIREAIRAIRMGYKNGKKQNIKIIGEQSAESSVNEVKPQTDSEMKKEQENTKKARKEAGLPDIGKNYGERVSALEDAYSLNPNAENYAYKDTGYIAGSQREKVQNTLKRKAEMGETVNVDDVDWNALEENSRTAAQLITKDNIIGKIDYQKMKDKGIDSRAAAMITSIYRSIGKEPVDNTPEGRKNFVWAISTLRERLESCKTYKEVFAMIKEIGEERSGKYTTLLSMDSEYGELETQYNNIINSQKEINNKIINNYNLNLNRKFKNKEERTEYWQNFLKKEYPGLDEFKISYGYYSSPHEKLPYISIEETKINELREKKKAAFKGAVERIELANPMLKAWKQLGDKCLDDYGRPAKSIFDYYNAFTNLEIWKGSTAFTSQKDSNYAKYLNWGWEEKDKTKKEQSSIVKGRVKQKFEMIVPDKYERIGGRNVSVDSSQELKKAYNFREVQVGTWVQTDVASAKWHTDNINEGFADLCDITGIPDNLVSMNGRIAIAIGARGVRGAKAHYEPGERVIQINKMKGGGSLGHEWFHAFDNLISEAINGGDYNEWFTWQGKEQIKMASSHGNNKSSVKQVVSNNNDSLNQKVRDKFTNLVHAMMEGDTPETNTVEFDEEKWNKCQSFYNLKTKIAKYKPRTLNAAQTFTDAKKIIDEYYDDRIAREKDYQSRGYTSGMSVEKLTQEKIKSLEFAAIKFADKEKGETEYLTGRVVSRYYQDAKKLGNGYWDTPHEMAARAFQCWLNDKLKEQGRKNTYLVGMVDNDKYGGVFYPYPTERDRIKINKAFDELFKVIKSENAIRKALLFEESAHPRGNGGQFIKKFAADKGGVFGGSYEASHINTKFNEELEEYKKGNLPPNHIFKLGKPNEILVKVGFPANDDIELRANQLQIKLDKHNFTVDDIKDLPEMLQKPVAVFKYGDEKKAQNIIVELQKDGKNFLVGVHFKNQGMDVSNIRGLFNRDNHEWLNWITKGKALYVNTKKLQNLINQQRINLADVEYLDLESIESLLKKNSGVKDLFLTQEMNVEIRKSRFINRLNHEFCKLVEREKRKEAYLDKLGRGYIAYLKKHYPELV